MAHGANFVGNRLRLSAFLLCVEQRAIPNRPSRFTRPPQTLEANDSRVPIYPRMHCDVPARDACNESPALASRLSAKTGTISSDVDEKTAIVDVPQQSAVEDGQQPVLDSLTNAPPIFDTVRSSTPDLRSSQFSTNEQGSRDIPEQHKYHIEPKSFSLSKTNASIAASNVVDKTSGNIKGLASTRKRRLPVHELALLRTTTLDGLPLPGDATLSIAAPITVVDPIEDCQIHLMNTSKSPILGIINITNNRLSPTTAKPPDLASVSQIRPMGNFNEPLQKSAQLSTEMPRYDRDYRDACDGFVGSELKLAPRNSLGRQRKANSTKKQRFNTKRELVLRAGSPFSSAGWAMGTTVAPIVDKTSHPVGESTAPGLENAQAQARLGQLTPMRRHNALQAGTNDKHIF